MVNSQHVTTYSYQKTFGKHMLEPREKTIVTPTPTQTTSDTWLGFFTGDGEAVTIKGKKVNGDFLQMRLHSSNEVDGNWYPIRIIMRMDKKWFLHMF